MASKNMSAEDILDEDQSYSLLAPEDVQLCFSEPEWEEMQTPRPHDGEEDEAELDFSINMFTQWGFEIASIDYIYRQHRLDVRIKDGTFSL